MDLLSTYYLTALLKMRRGMAFGSPSNAKPIMFIAIIKGIEEGSIIGNKIEFNEVLDKNYHDLCNLFEPTKKAAHLFKPFYYSSTEGYFNLKWKDCNMPPQSCLTPSAKFLRERLDYAFLDEPLWTLLQDKEVREVFRSSLISHFLGRTHN